MNSATTNWEVEGKETTTIYTECYIASTDLYAKLIMMNEMLHKVGGIGSLLTEVLLDYSAETWRTQL